MKKILFIHHWSTIGGSGISLFNTWKSLQDHYVVVTYIPDNPLSLFEFLSAKGLNSKTYSFTCGQLSYYSGGSSPLKPGFWYSLYNALMQIPYWRKVVKTEQPDIIIVNSKVLCWMGKIFKEKKSVCIVRETINGNPNNLLNRIMKRLLENFTLVSFLSEYDLIQTNLKKASTVVSPDFLFSENYVDILGKKVACEQLDINENSFNIAFAGGINKLKGIDLALEAMNYLKNENINLIVAGEEIDAIINQSSNIFSFNVFKKVRLRFAKNIKKYIANNELQDKVKFVGVQKDISILYSASDILIFPMKKPHQARPAFEIGIQKKPVIITDFPNIREFVKDGVNGLTFEPNNPESLAQAILKLKNDRVLLNLLGEANYEFTLEYHTESYAMGKLMNAIKEIM